MELAAYSWEAVLTLALSRQREGGQEQICFWRASRPLDEVPLGKASGSERVDGVAIGRKVDVFWSSRLPLRGGSTQLVAAERWQVLFRDAWREPDALPDRKVLIATDPPLAYAGEEEIPLLLHVIGTPLQTSAGLRLEIEHSGQPADRATLQSSRVDSALFGSESLPVREVPIFVLQLEPADLLSTRSDAEREKMGYLRVFAAEVFDRGASAVIALPLLSPELSKRVIAVLAAHLQHGSPTRRQLLDAVSEMRRVIAEWSPPVRDKAPALQRLSTFVRPSLAKASTWSIVQRELALDVCLFLS